MIKEKTLEELRLDLIEIQAYRDLQDEEFCFDKVNTIKNESVDSEDAYYEILEQDILDAIEYLENKKIENKSKKKIKKRNI